MHRRSFLTLLGISTAASAWPLVARAQQGAMPVVGTLYAVSRTEWADRFAAIRLGLNEMAFVEGRNLVIDNRSAEAQFDRLMSMAADLVRRKPVVILAGGSDLAVHAAMAGTKTIPIVIT